MLRKIKIGIAFCLITLFANTANAASLLFVPSSGEYTPGQEIAVNLKINSDGVGINAAQATLRFPKDMLSVKSISKDDSILNFWLEEPTFSNENGVISFIGGTPYGISGASLQVLHIVFAPKGSGNAPITIADAAITASDGTGTNVLSKTTDAVFTISPTVTTTTAVTPSQETTQLVVTPPVQIVRTPTPASGLPTKPVVTVPLYSDPTAWSNNSNAFGVSWALPSDITGVATAINKQPTFTPETAEGLFDNKTFPALADGVWYLHVQFKNQVGWGPVAHYRIAVDTKAPVPFEITSNESTSSDNPTPTLSFKSSDALSGLREYRIKINNEAWVTVSSKDFKGSYQLVIKNPGIHHITVQAVDKAGNSIENTFEHETLALTSPVFTFSTETLYSDESKGLSFKGTALPSTEILLLVKKGAEVITSDTITVDAQGNWEFTYTNPLRNGKYIATIQNRDSRGALSLVITAPTISVTGRYDTLLTILFLALGATIILGFVFFKNRRDRTHLRIKVAGSDTAKVFKMIEDDVQKLQEAQKAHSDVNAEFIAEKIKKNVNKMGKYVKDEIDRAKD